MCVGDSTKCHRNCQLQRDHFDKDDSKAKKNGFVIGFYVVVMYLIHNGMLYFNIYEAVGCCYSTPFNTSYSLIPFICMLGAFSFCFCRLSVFDEA